MGGIYMLFGDYQSNGTWGTNYLGKKKWKSLGSVEIGQQLKMRRLERKQGRNNQTARTLIQRYSFYFSSLALARFYSWVSQ